MRTRINFASIRRPPGACLVPLECSKGHRIGISGAYIAAGMKRAWNQVRRHPRVAALIDFYGMGLLILSPQEGILSRTYSFGIR